MKKLPLEDCLNWSESPKKTLTQALLEKGARLAASERKRLGKYKTADDYPWPRCVQYIEVPPDRPYQVIKRPLYDYNKPISGYNDIVYDDYKVVSIPPIHAFNEQAFVPVFSGVNPAEWFMDLQDIVQRTVNNRKDRTSKESILSRLKALSKGEGEGGEGGTYKEGDKVEGDVV